MTTDWHATNAMLLQYAEVRCDPVTAYSIETHLERCSTCRSALSRLARSEREQVELIWERIVDVIDQPAAPPLARALQRVGMPQTWVLLTVSTRAMGIRWLSVQTVLMSALLLFVRIRGGSSDIGPFLLVAPIMPAVAVLIAYHSRFDSLAEVTAATPMAGARLALTRIAAVLSVTMGLLFVAGLLLERGWMTLAWVLPALAVAGCALSLTTFVGAERGVACAIVSWIVIWASLYIRNAAANRLNSLVAEGFYGTAQWWWAAACVTVGAIVYLRRAQFELSLELQREGHR